MGSELAVIPRDIICYRRTGFAKINKATLQYPLRFQASEELFHWAAIPANLTPEEYRLMAEKPEISKRCCLASARETPGQAPSPKRDSL